MHARPSKPLKSAHYLCNLRVLIVATLYGNRLHLCGLTARSALGRAYPLLLAALRYSPVYLYINLDSAAPHVSDNNIFLKKFKWWRLKGVIGAKFCNGSVIIIRGARQ